MQTSTTILTPAETLLYLLKNEPKLEQHIFCIEKEEFFTTLTMSHPGETTPEPVSGGPRVPATRH